MFVGCRIVFVGRRRFAVNGVIVAVGRNGAAVVVMPPRTPVGLVFCGALRAALFVDQRLPVGDRDLIVIGMNFAEGEEAMAVAAIIDEGRLQRRLDARHHG